MQKNDKINEQSISTVNGNGHFEDGVLGEVITRSGGSMEQVTW